MAVLAPKESWNMLRDRPDVQALLAISGMHVRYCEKRHNRGYDTAGYWAVYKQPPDWALVYPAIRPASVRMNAHIEVWRKAIIEYLERFERAYGQRNR